MGPGLSGNIKKSNQVTKINCYASRSIFHSCHKRSPGRRGDPHKNHLVLIQAWCMLASEGIFPSLCLTVSQSQFVVLCKELDRLRKLYNLNVENLGELSRDSIKKLYEESGALIYPSKLESFGLPLVEARQAGLSILAPELDYVRDLIDPEETFDPDSAVSIARAIKRYMGLADGTLPLLTANEFIDRILIRAR